MDFSKVPLRAWFATLALGSLGLVAVGMELQTLLRLAPCPFCIFQRLLYMVIGVLALAGVILSMQAFPHLVNECGFSDPNAIERLVDWLGMQLPNFFLATGFCSSKEWVFLTLSMANWSFLIYLGIIAYAALLISKKN